MKKVKSKKSPNHFCLQKGLRPLLAGASGSGQAKVKNCLGFTLIELLIAIAIVAVLVSLLTVAFNRAQKRARDTKVMSDLKDVQKAFENFYAVNSSYPTGLSVDGENLSSYFAGGQVLETDPKGDDYNYDWGSADGGYYCVCSNALDIAGSGNASDTDCTFAAAGNYYCVQGLQSED